MIHKVLNNKSSDKVICKHSSVVNRNVNNIPMNNITHNALEICTQVGEKECDVGRARIRDD